MTNRKFSKLFDLQKRNPNEKLSQVQNYRFTKGIKYFLNGSDSTQKEIHNFLNVLKPSGYIICCDFKIFYNRYTDFLNLKIIKNKYDYEKNLGSYNLAKEIKQINSDSMLLNFNCNIKEFVHLILTEKIIKNALMELMGKKN